MRALIHTAALIGIGWAVQASAASYTEPFLNHINDNGGQGINYQVGFNDFTPALGTLNSVTLALTGTYMARFDAFELNSPLTSFTFLRPTLYVNGQTIAVFPDIAGTITGNSSITTAMASFPVSVSFNLNPSFSNGGGSGFSQLGGNDSFYLSGGFGTPAGIGASDIEDNPSLSFNGTLTFNYTPTSVPEPASMALLAMGALMAGVACHYRQRG